MCSKYQNTRNIAHKIMYTISKSQANGFEFGNFFSITTTRCERVYLRTVELYSAYVAKLKSLISPEFFVEADITVDIVGDETLANVMRVIIPWANNYGHVIKANTESETQTSYKLTGEAHSRFLSSVYSITIKLHHKFPTLVEKMWYQLMESRFVFVR